MFNAGDQGGDRRSPVACSEYTWRRLQQSSPRQIAATIALCIQYITCNMQFIELYYIFDIFCISAENDTLQLSLGVLSSRFLFWVLRLWSIKFVLIILIYILPGKAILEMTCTVLGRTLNPTDSLTHS